KSRPYIPQSSRPREFSYKPVGGLLVSGYAKRQGPHRSFTTLVVNKSADGLRRPSAGGAAQQRMSDARASGGRKAARLVVQDDCNTQTMLSLAPGGRASSFMSTLLKSHC